MSDTVKRDWVHASNSQISESSAAGVTANCSNSCVLLLIRSVNAQGPSRSTSAACAIHPNLRLDMTVAATRKNRRRCTHRCCETDGITRWTCESSIAEARRSTLASVERLRCSSISHSPSSDQDKDVPRCCSSAAADCSDRNTLVARSHNQGVIATVSRID